jgi:CRP-like cAMP-binding protein
LTHAVQKSSSENGALGYESDSGEFAYTWVDYLAEAQGTVPETLDDQSRFAQYVACVYWATTTMTTIGYGDIVPFTPVERTVAILAQLVGSCVFLYGLTQVTALVADKNSGDVEFQRVLDDANHYFEKRSVPKRLRQKVKDHLHQRRFFFASSSVGGGGGFERSSSRSSCANPSSRRGRRRGDLASALDGFDADDDGERRIFSRVSSEVRRELRVWSLRDALNRQPYLRDFNETFVKICTDFLKRRFFGPGERIIAAGDIGRELFFLSRGEAEVRTGKTSRRTRALLEGDLFGEIAVVLARKRVRRTADVRATAFVETLVLSDWAYREAALAAPETARAVECAASATFKKVNERRWRAAVVAVIAVNAVLNNAGFPRLADAKRAEDANERRRVRSLSNGETRLV